MRNEHKDDDNYDSMMETSKESKSIVEVYAERNRKLEELKTRVAHLATSVITHPEINVKKLRELISMFDIKSDDNEFGLIFLSIQKIVAFSALEVFRDIIPNYRVKEKINEEDDDDALKKKGNKRKKIQLKKDTLRLRDYEKSLLQIYRLYLQRLQRMVQCISKGRSSKKSNFYDVMIHSKRVKERIAIIGIKCFIQLIVTHPHFNFRNQIIETIVPLMGNNNHPIIAEMCCNAISQLYKSDKSGEVSLEAVKATAKLVKARKSNISPNVLKTFLSLKIKDVKKKGDDLSKKDMKKIRTKMDMMSRRERKRNKRMQKLENQLLEADAEESKDRKIKFHTEIINQIFVTYFRILKHNAYDDDNDVNKKQWLKTILSPVLEGLSKYAHLINIEFFDDLISVLYRLIQSNQLNDHQCLHCLQTIFIILSAEGSALNIDPQRFYCHLYKTLFNINTFTDADDIRILISCIETMILKRKKQITHHRILAFIKRLSTMTLQTEHHSSIALLNAIRQIMNNHKQSDILLDTESSGIGSGVFMPEIEDPEYCNANATILWEILYLRRHYHPTVKQFASHILNSCKGSEVSMHILKRNSSELYEDYYSRDDPFEFTYEKHMQSNAKRARFQSYNSIIDSESSISSQGYQLLQEFDNCFNNN